MFRDLVGLYDGQPRRGRGLPGLSRSAPKLSSRPAHPGLSDFIVESRACAFDFGQCCVQLFPRSVQFFMREIDDLGHRVALPDNAVRFGSAIGRRSSLQCSVSSADGPGRSTPVIERAGLYQGGKVRQP
jgi:hypothetical protein